MFSDSGFNLEKFREIYPDMENILRFGSYVQEIESNRMYWSKGVFAILGVEPYSMESRIENFMKFVHPQDADYVLSAKRGAMESRKPYQIEFSIIDAQGNLKRIYAENHMRHDENGEVVEYVGLMRDVTEKYLNNQELEQKIAQLDKSNQNLQEFVYVASHDLQEPLRKISTFTDRLQLKFGHTLDPEARMYLERISSVNKNMQTLLEDLLDFSRLSFTDKEFEKVCVESIIRDVLSDLEIKMVESKAEISCENLPKVDAYPSQLRQLFSNLISNAIKFKKPDTQLEISITCTPVDHRDYPSLPLRKNTDYIRILIRDNGIGFEQEYAEHIFAIFQRLHGKAEYVGSGIGLAICKKIMDNHHGFIFAEGVVDRGADFTLLLPKHQV